MSKKVKQYFKLFRKAKTEEKRRAILANWTMEVFSEFNNLSQGWAPKQNQAYFVKLNVEAQKFCTRPMKGEEWALDKDWLKLIIANIAPTENTGKMFYLLGWDFNKALNPVARETSTIQEYLWKDPDKEDEVVIPFLLTSRGHTPTGSKWVFGKGSGQVWELQFSDKNIVEIINPKHSLVRKINRKEFVRDYRKV
jgi:hypothetical protein